MTRSVSPIGRSPSRRDLGFALLAALELASQRGFEEEIEPPIENGLRVPGFHARAQILNELIRVKNVGTDLVAPADIRLLRFLGLEFRLVEGAGVLGLLQVDQLLADGGGDVGIAPVADGDAAAGEQREGEDRFMGFFLDGVKAKDR